MTLNDEIYKEIAKELGIHRDKVEEMCRAQFEFISNTMEEGQFKAVRLPYMGIFRCKPERLKKLGYVSDADTSR